MAEKTRNTFQKTRLALFVRSYVACSISNHLRIKYRIDDKLTKPQLRKQFLSKRAIPEISRLSKALNLKYQLLWQFVVFDKKQNLNRKIRIDEKIKAFLATEFEMTFLAIARQDKENIIHEDYERALLSPALERVAGNSLKNTRDDLVFEIQLEELRKRYQRWYYDIAHEYKLPTLVNSPFILRLISS